MAGFLSILGSLIIIFIAFVSYRLNFLLQPFANPTIINNNCQRLKGRFAMEDMVPFGNILLAGSYDRRSVFIPERVGDILPGELAVIDIEDKSITTLQIQDTPRNFVIRPHGISLHNNKTLYVISHDENSNNEKVEVIDVSVDLNNKVVLRYLKTLNFGKEYLNLFNGIVAIGDNDEFYITQYHSHSVKETESYKPVSQVKDLVAKIFGLKQTYVYYCKGSTKINNSEKESKPNCTKLDITAGNANNGVAFIEESNKLYVADIGYRMVRVYKVDSNDRSKLSLIKEIGLEYSPDNLHYDEKLRKIFVGSLGPFIKISEWINHLKTTGDIDNKISRWASGGSSINIDNNDEVKVEVMQDDLLIGCSNLVVSRNRFVLSSFIDDGILICDK